MDSIGRGVLDPRMRGDDGRDLGASVGSQAPQRPSKATFLTRITRRQPSKLVNSLLTAVAESLVRRRSIRPQARSRCAPIHADAAERDEQMSLARQAMFGAAETTMSPVQILFEQARTFHDNGNLAEAEARYRKVLKKRPNHFEAWHMLGLANSPAATTRRRRAR